MKRMFWLTVQLLPTTKRAITMTYHPKGVARSRRMRVTKARKN